MIENLMFSLSHLSTAIMWVIFAIVVGTMLFLDLVVFHAGSEGPKMKSTLRICLAYMFIACLFGVFVLYEKGSESAMMFFTGYMVEFSLSMDNIFVMSLIFTTLSIPVRYQHRVLFWGILGAVFMRAGMILLGNTLIEEFHWILYIFSAFLVYTGIKFVAQKEKKDLRQSGFYKIVHNRFHVTDIHGEDFIVKENGKRHITPLLFALIIIELMDIVFALDSIPAIFLITQDVFIVYTSNIFAILGLRSLYFLLSGAVNRFEYLKYSLSVILVFIGAKIFLPFVGITVSAGMSLMITLMILATGIFASLFKQKQHKMA